MFPTYVVMKRLRLGFELRVEKKYHFINDILMLHRQLTSIYKLLKAFFS